MSEQTEQTRTEPTEAAMRAAKCSPQGGERIARAIDEATGLPEVVEALEQIHNISLESKDYREALVSVRGVAAHALAHLKGEQDG